MGTSKRLGGAEALLEELLENAPLTILDAGARGGTLELPRLAPFCRVFGFEPHPAAFESLQQHLESGDHLPYQSVRYFPEALAQEAGEVILHLAGNPSYSSILEVDWKVYERHLLFMRRFEEWKEDITSGSSITVPATTLDRAAANLGLSRVDLLKLDTQGTELRILKGGQDLLERGAVGVIKCEISFIPFYRDQCLFADVDLFLRNLGFEYLDCQFDQRVIREPPEAGSAGSSPVPGIHDPTRYTAGGDAIYFRLPEAEKAKAQQEQALRTGLVLAAMGYYSPAYHLWRHYEALSADEAGRLLRYLARQTWRERLRNWVERWAPPALLEWWRGWLNS